MGHSRSLEIAPFDRSYEFLLALCSNYGPILYHFRDKAIYWSKIAIFSYALHLTLPLGTGVPVGII